MVFVLLLLFQNILAFAGKDDVIRVAVTKPGNHTYQFYTKVSHNDKDWIHYISKWNIMGPENIFWALGGDIIHMSKSSPLHAGCRLI